MSGKGEGGTDILKGHNNLRGAPEHEGRGHENLSMPPPVLVIGAAKIEILVVKK